MANHADSRQRRVLCERSFALVLLSYATLAYAAGPLPDGGRFVASTLDVPDDAFMSGGALTFSGSGAGTVVNLGKISSTSGDVFLIARTLSENDGTVSAPKGSAELAAGDQVLVRDSSTAPQTYVQATHHGDVGRDAPPLIAYCFCISFRGRPAGPR